MPFALNGDVKLYYEHLGAPIGRNVLLINGAGRQCIDFADAFCRDMVAQDFRVIRYDQRDTGLSTSFVGCRPSACAVAEALAARQPPSLPYDIGALAADAMAVLDASGAGRAHVFGRSLGSAVAQVIALERPDRIQSLTLAMAFSRGIGQTIPPDRLRELDTEHFESVASFVARQVQVARAVGNPAYFDLEQVQADAARAFQRGVHAGANSRHFMVGLAMPDLRPRLSELKMPVQIIHGRLDRIIPLHFAEETAAAIPQAKLAVLDDMAHEAPAPLWRRWIDLFVQNAAAAQSKPLPLQSMANT
jgi:pimeloyl-ACP methyl ester carboxylesterase